MSQKETSEWLLAAQENVDEALADNNYKLAESIIKDVHDEGYEQEAAVMEEAMGMKLLGDETDKTL